MKTDIGHGFAMAMNASAIDQMAGWAETAAENLEGCARDRHFDGKLQEAKKYLDDADTFKQFAYYARLIGGCDRK